MDNGYLMIASKLSPC